MKASREGARGRTPEGRAAEGTAEEDGSAGRRAEAAGRSVPTSPSKPAATGRPDGASTRGRDRLREAYRNALRSAVLDERLAEWSARGLIGFQLPPLEWGGLLAAAAAALEPGDWLFPGLREARVALWRGMALEDFLAQALGVAPATGTLLPTMPGYICDAAHRVASVAGGVAAQLPHAVGAAFAARHRRESDVALTICGSAAIDSPDFHVACNFAGVWRAPVIFLVRREGEGLFASAAERGAAYGIAAATASAAEPRALLAVLDEALARARKGAGATLIEVVAPTDAAAAVEALRRAQDGAGGSAHEEAKLRGEALAWCEAAFEAARAGKRPGLAALTAHVYAADERHLAAQLADLVVAPTAIPDDV